MNKSRPMLSLGIMEPLGKFEAYTWEQNTGRLVVGVTADIDDTSDGDNVLSFTFDVENPAEGQPARTIWLQGSFNDSLTYDSDGRWHDRAGTPSVKDGGWVTQGSAWSLQRGRTYDPSVAIWKSANPEYNVNTTNETRTGYPAQDQYNRYFNEIRNLSYWATLPGEDIPEPSDQTYFPGYVQHPKVAFAMAGQSSPWPCDTNTITVIMQSNVPLIKRCQPVITVTNLQNVADRRRRRTHSRPWRPASR
jgi:hypothetical protein